MTQKGAARTAGTDQTAKKAKRLFFTGLFDLSWKLGAAIILPVLLGAYIDERQNSGSTFTVLGLFAGFAISAFVIRSIVIRLSREVS